MKYSRAVRQYRDRAGHRSAWLILALIVGLIPRFAASQEVLGPPPDGQKTTGIGFDQIDRILLHGEAPPPIDSFTADAAVIASLPPPPLKGNAQSIGGTIAKSAGTMVVSSALSFVPIAGPLIAGAGSRSLNAVEQVEQQHETEKHNTALSSPAALGIAPLQDLVNLGSEARMNVPGRADGNWRWRVREDMLSSQAFQWLLDLTESSKRSVTPATSVRAQVACEGATSFR